MGRYILLLLGALCVACPAAAPLTVADLDEQKATCVRDSSAQAWAEFTACELAKDRTGDCATNAINAREVERHERCVK